MYQIGMEVVVGVVFVADAALRGMRTAPWHHHQLSAVQQAVELPEKNMGGPILLNLSGLLCCQCPECGAKPGTDLLGGLTGQGLLVTEKSQKHFHAQLQPCYHLRDSAVTGDGGLLKGGSGFQKLCSERRDKFLCGAAALGEKAVPEPAEIGIHTPAEGSPFGFLLESGEQLQIHLAWMQVQFKVPGGTAFSDVGSSLAGENGIALGRSGVHDGGIGAQPSLSNPIPIAPHDTLGGLCEDGFLGPGRRVIVIDTGQYILQGKGIGQDAVGGIPEGEGKQTAVEPSEEGENQCRKAAFSGSASANEKENEFWFVSSQLEEVIQRREKSQRQHGKEDCLRCRRMLQQAGWRLNVSGVAPGFHGVSLQFSGELHSGIRLPWHEELPLPADLHPAGDGVEMLPLGCGGGGLDGIADGLPDILADLQDVVHAPVPGQPVEGGQLRGRYSDGWQPSTGFVDALQGDVGVGFKSVVQNQLRSNPGSKIAELPLALPVGPLPDFHKAVVYGFELGCVGNFYICQWMYLLIKFCYFSVLSASYIIKHKEAK